MVASNVDSNDYYQVLGVEKKATDAEISKVISHYHKYDPENVQLLT